MMPTLPIALIPRDGLFCKDARGWSASSSGRGHALDWPYPSTVLGALRTARGRMLEQHEARPLDRDAWHRIADDLRLGRSVALRREWSREHAWTCMWPVPGDVRMVEHEGGTAIEYLDPREPRVQTLGRDGDHTHPRERLWIPLTTGGKPKPKPRWWAHDAFVALLCAPRSGPAPVGFDLPRRHQTHVSIQANAQTAVDGALFSHDIVETFEREAEWAIGCELLADRQERPDFVTLGSDRRLTRVEDLDGSTFDIPPILEQSFARERPLGLRLIAITPLEFDRGWLPDGLRVEDAYRGRLGPLDCEVELRSAMIDRPLAISGWDMIVGKPKPTARMIPPGSVFALQRVDRQPFTLEQARALWLAAIGQRTSEGFGRVVPGVWHPNRESNNG